MKKYQKLNKLKNLKSICVITHLEPDTDALASAVIFKSFLLQKFKTQNVDIFTDYKNLLDNYYCLFEGETLNKTPSKYDAVVVLDCPNLERLGKFKFLYDENILTINIDHHATNVIKAKISIVEQISSTCEILFNILKEFKYKFKKDVYGKIYAGIITDTCNFTVGNYNSETFEIASECCKFINSADIYKQFLSNNSLKNMQLLACAIKNIKSYNNNNIIISHITEKELNSIGATFNDYTGVINRLASISNSKLVCLIEAKNNNFYVSMRADKGYDVSKIARLNNGGGHKGAAAFMSTKTIEEIENYILDEFNKTLSATPQNKNFKF